MKALELYQELEAEFEEGEVVVLFDAYSKTHFTVDRHVVLAGGKNALALNRVPAGEVGELLGGERDDEAGD